MAIDKDQQASKGVRSSRARKNAEKPEAKNADQAAFDNLFNPTKPKRSRKAAPKQAEQQQPEVIDVEPVQTESTAIKANGPQPHEGRFIEEDPAKQAEDREKLVLEFVNIESAVEGRESALILQMIDHIVQGKAEVAEFVKAFAVLAAPKLAPNSLKSRKSNLNGVLSFAAERPDYRLAITPQKVKDADGNETADIDPKTVLGLQAMYAKRQELLNGPKEPKQPRTPKAQVMDEPEAPESRMSPTDLMLHQMTNAIDAAVDAGFPEIAEKIRKIQIEAQAEVTARLADAAAKAAEHVKQDEGETIEG